MRSVHDVVHVRGCTRSPIAQKMIQEFFIYLEQNRSARFFLLLEVTSRFMELKTAGGVMTKLIERNTAIHTNKGNKSHRTLTIRQMF